MNKYLVSSLTFACVLGLGACNNETETGMEQRYDNRTQPIGYYSNAEERGNARMLDSREGPLTEVIDGDDDRHATTRRMRTINVNDGRYDGPTGTYGYGQPYSQQTEGLYKSNARLGENDRNYHGHLNSTRSLAKTSYYKGYPGDLTEKVASRVEGVQGVENCRAVVDGNRMLVAINPSNTNMNEEELEQHVAKQINSLTNGKYDVQVEVDNGTYNSVRSIDNDLRNGGENGLIRTNINSLFESIDENINRKDR
ncbi:YhcN/YlaJ family sporulation lipoprotein [Metabacillus iocasae]|uniref:Spore cortex protein CoxA n=1 Tax=Priestia iocasae TaxID=2291674 RepID=A0ABS2QPL9_9BACI|nr:YhcN/YlaJ family sporulation lipoprotein [Metabacillus iocasae]MBM7701387.1 hypothetical protein [Metabacillus iocasae]